MQRWVSFAIAGMLSLVGTGCATESHPASSPVSSPRPLVVTPPRPTTRPAAQPPVTRASTTAKRPTTRPRPATLPVVTAQPTPAAPPKPRPEFWDGHGKCEGIASFYGGKFIGRRTANGERYTGRKLTAAHRVLPFGTHVRVTRIDTGLSVIVRINDRGPYIDGRVIDLSPAAARRIHMTKDGITPVKLEVVASWMAEE